MSVFAHAIRNMFAERNIELFLMPNAEFSEYADIAILYHIHHWSDSDVCVGEKLKWLVEGWKQKDIKRVA